MLKIEKFSDDDYTKALVKGEVEGKDFLGLFRVYDVLPIVCGEGCEYIICTDSEEQYETNLKIKALKDKIYFDERYTSLDNLFKVNKLHYYNIDRLKNTKSDRVCQVYYFEGLTIYYVVNKHKLIFALDEGGRNYISENLWDTNDTVIGMLHVYGDVLMYDTRRKAICYREKAKVVHEFKFYKILEEIKRRECEFEANINDYHNPKR